MTTFARRLIQLEPGDVLHDGDPLWQNAIVVVIAGALDVECFLGESHCFGSGSILTLARLPIRRAHNGGAAPTRLLVIWRTDAVPVSLARPDRHTEKDHE